jgi:serine/threonine-protein kinase RsbW
MSATERFPYDLRSVPAARHFLREQLSRFSPETVEAAELMLSELATNSIRHARSGFEVSVRAGKEIRVEVTDVGAGQPRVLSPRPTDPSGRGLRIVEGLSEQWGVASRDSGKMVWFTLAPQSPSSSESDRRGGALRHSRLPA